MAEILLKKFADAVFWVLLLYHFHIQISIIQRNQKLKKIVAMWFPPDSSALRVIQRSHQLSYRCNLGIILRFVSVTSVWCSTEGYANFGSQKHEKTIGYFHYVTTHQNIIQSIYWSFLVLMSYKENSHFTPWIEFEWKIPCRHILRLDDLYDCTLPRKKCTHITQVIQ